METKRERYTPHDVGPSPLDWEAPFLAEVSSLITNGFVGTATPHYTDESGVPYFYGKNVRANYLDPRGIRYITSEFHAAQSKTALREGDLLTVQSGHIGETAIVTKEYEGSNCHALIVTRPKKEAVYPQFLSYYINSEMGRARLKGLEVGSTILHINTKDLKKFRVLLPPLLEQRKIAKILSTWDKAISNTERLINNSKQQKKALMQQLLTGKKRLLDDSGKPFEGEWEEVMLGEIARIYQPKTISKSKLTSTGYPVYGANGIIGNYSDFNHDTEQVAVTCRGSTCGVVNWTLPKSWITGNAMVVNLDANKRCFKKFIYYLLAGSNLKYLITGSGQPQITGEIKNHKIFLPIKDEQEKVAAVLTNADKEVELLEQQLVDLKQEKKALMQQLLTGKRRVKIDDKEVA